ncbi:MAG: hypothetical protein OEV65_19730 [Aquincola sp.]|nr:hypothetical protein [Aquincola sp.]
MVTGQAVIRVIAGAPNLVEQVTYFTRDDALVLQAVQQVGASARAAHRAPEGA